MQLGSVANVCLVPEEATKPFSRVSVPFLLYSQQHMRDPVSLHPRQPLALSPFAVRCSDRYGVALSQFDFAFS